jgi:hypothetical protein
MISYALAYALGGLTVYFWPQIKSAVLGAYDWVVSKI